MDWDSPDIEALITSALAEDVGSGDVTVAATLSPKASCSARLVAMQDLVCAGLPLVEKVFGRLDADISVELRAVDGESVRRGAVLAILNGNAGAILSGEQTVVNVVSRLCGIATLTREYAGQIAGTQARIRDTRGTTPALRALEQYAIRMGGGVHHRAGLFDGIVLTHARVAAAGGIKPALDQAHSCGSRLMNPQAISAYEAVGDVPDETASNSLPVQIEIGSEAELREALSAGAESVLLTDMAPLEAIRLAALARSIRSDCVIEISGDISLAGARAYAQAGVDYLSPRALTAAAPWASLRMLVDGPQEK